MTPAGVWNFGPIQNAAFAVFVALIRQAITHFDLDFYMPIVKVAENMDQAHTQDAVRTQNFYWRTLMKNGDSKSDVKVFVAEEYGLTTIDEIVNSHQGLLRPVERFLREQAVDDDVRQKLQPYLDFICGRVNGNLWTPASWMRDFVLAHERYVEHSVVSERICYALLTEVRALGTGLGERRETFARPKRDVVPGEA